MRSTPRQERASAISVKPPRDAHRRMYPAQAKLKHSQRVVWNAKRREHVLKQLLTIAQERANQAAVTCAVHLELADGLIHRFAQKNRGFTIQRMSNGCGRVNPVQAVLLQWQSTKQGREGGHRVDGRADVVNEPGKRQLAAASASADHFFRF